MGINYDELDEEIDRDLGIVKPREHPTLKRWGTRLRWLAKPFGIAFKGLYKILRFPVIPALSIANYKQGEDGKVVEVPTARRVIEGLLTRLLLTPFMIVIFVVILVWYTTHPTQIQAAQSPKSCGLYYRSVGLETSDGQHISAWFIPGITTSEVVRNGEEALLERRPAAILIHGLGYGQEQYLPLATQLQNAGFSVLMLNLRGQNEASNTKHPGVTFGLREKLDVLAAIRYLRDIPHIDPHKIALVGYGVGANAALQAALLDPSIAAVVAEDPWPSFDAWTTHNFDFPYVPANLLASMYRMGFEVAYRERVSQLDLAPTLHYLHQTAILMVLHTATDGLPVEELIKTQEDLHCPHQLLVVNADDPKATPTALAGTITSQLAELMQWTPAQERISENLKRMFHARIK